MLHTSEQFTTMQLMEHLENVAQGVTDRQAVRRERQTAAAAPTTTSTCVKPADLGYMTEMIP